MEVGVGFVGVVAECRFVGEVAEVDRSFGWRRPLERLCKVLLEVEVDTVDLDLEEVECIADQEVVRIVAQEVARIADLEAERIADLEVVEKHVERPEEGLLVVAHLEVALLGVVLSEVDIDLQEEVGLDHLVERLVSYMVVAVLVTYS